MVLVSTLQAPKPLAVAVFCGAKTGANPLFTSSATELAQALHNQGWSLVYGGGTVGLMGQVARELVLRSGHEAVHGIIPGPLLTVERARNPDEHGSETQREGKYGRLTVVKDMHARKTLMAKMADAFVALPGGFGTMEELFEIITWNFLGIHAKPIVILNVDGYYDDIIKWVRKAVDEKFVDGGNADIVVEAKSAEEVVERIKRYRLGTCRHELNWGIQ